MAHRILLGLSTFAGPDEARKIADQLVTEKRAACANILPAIDSVYAWKGKIERGTETLVFFKLSESRQSAFQTRLRELHSYDVPEIIFLPVADGLPEYLRWVTESCQ
jgi:periplasmic divalent cation tolerance protein